MFKLYNLVIYSGVLALISFVATFFLGVTRLNIEAHEIMGITTLVLVLFHGGLVLYAKIRAKTRK
ncbi:MAG: hypothetical protein PHE61_02020 [Candidatus Omnitrophica bacterium]|nr:hypothetical protein [Candidatus Omnitrophota bacterium]